MLERIFKFRSLLSFFLIASFLGAGFLIWALNQSNHSFELELARDYAPNFWFDSEEKYYPCSPLDFYYDENLNEIPGETAKQNYDKLSKEEKIKHFRVFYEIKEKPEEIIIEYWLFYVFNQFTNEHYGDWESVFVFVNKENGKINRIVGSAHVGSETKIFLANNELKNPKSNHINILVEKGSHANCPDGNGDGLFERTEDITNWYNSYAFYLFRNWSQEDKTHGLRISHTNPNYKLEKLSVLKQSLKGKESFDRSHILGIPVVKIGKRYYYLPLGGKPSDLASIEEKVENPEKVKPFTFETFKEKISQFVQVTKNKVNKITKKFKEKLIGIKTRISFLSFQKAEVSQVLEIKKEQLKEKREKEKLEKEKEEIEEKTQENKTEKKISKKESIEKKISEIKREDKEKENFKKRKRMEKLEKETKELLEKTSSLNEKILSLRKSQSQEDLTKEKEISKKTSSKEKKSSFKFVPFVPASGETSTADTIPPNILSFNFSLKDFVVHLNWEGEDESGISGYDLEFKKEGEDWNTLLEDTLETETDFQGENGETFYFRLRAKDNFGNISDWQEISVKIEKTADHLVINRVQISPSEYVELYNPTEKEIDLSNFYFSYFPVNEECEENLENCRDWSDPWLNKKFPEGEKIEAGGFYLIKVGEKEGEKNPIKADWQFKTKEGTLFSPKLNDEFGAIAIFPFDPKKENEEKLKEDYIDIFAWGFPQKVKEGDPFLDFNKNVSEKIFIRKKRWLRYK